MSGGEPLSEDVEALIAKVAPLARESVIASAEHTRIHAEKGGSSLEDAVANGREARADRAWVEAMGDEDDAALIDYLIRTRLASQESCRLLAEALEKIAAVGIEWPDSDPSWGSFAVVTAREALTTNGTHQHRFITDEDGAIHGCRCGAAYRSSEAGCIPCRKGEDHFEGVVYPCGSGK